MKRTFSTELAYVFGIVFVALGVVLMEKADFGVSMVVAPAYLLYRWLSPVWSFVTFGMAEYRLQAVLLLAMCLLLRFRVSYLFSFVTAVVYGFVLDAFMLLGAALPAGSVWLRVIYYIPAAKALREAGADFVWHIVGEGPERTKLEVLIADSGLESHVVLEGSKTNPYPYMKYAQLFVHPSYVESQGLTVLEAMALGVPCVVTKSRGPCEFIQDGISGLLTEQSPESLTARVLEILNDKALYQRICENTKCPEQYSPEQVMRQIETLIDA